MIHNSQVHRPLPFGWEEKAEDKLPASERAAKGDGTSYEPAKIGKSPNRYLGIIEFTDQGMLREPQQFFETNAFIKRKLSDQPLVLVIFVHGWNHNASPSDDNLRQFRRILLDLKPEIPTENIVGVYLGWPGNVPMLPYVSYFSRLNSAERVGRVTCTEVMLSLIAHAKLFQNGGKSGVRQKVKTIVIGHSMGGLIVEKAFLQAMIGYGLTNAATSDQLDALKNTQKAAKAMHLYEQTEAENICAESFAARPGAEIELQVAEKAFKTYRDTSNSLETQLNACVSYLKNMKDLTKYLSKTAEKLSGELNRVSQESTNAEVKNDLAAASGVLFHKNEGVRNSVYHLLQGLAGWAKHPESIVDKGSEDAFRQAPQEYLKELMTDTPQGQFVADELRKPLLSALRHLEGGSQDALGTRLKSFLDIAPFVKTDTDEIRSVGAFAQQFQDAWTSYNRTRQELKKWESSENFARLKAQYEDASTRLNKIENDINLAKARILYSVLGQAEVAELEAKLDLVRERPPADLILLINPASEALVTEQMRQVWDQERGGDLLRKMWRKEDTRPWIISISSKFDPVTRAIYPFAMGLSSFFRGAASPSEHAWMTHTAPHIPNMITHEVRRKKKSVDFELVDTRGKGVVHTPLWIVDADRGINPKHNIVTKNLVDLVPFLLREAEVLKNSEPGN